MTKRCSIPGCDNPVEARGWCNTHYTRWRKRGDPLMTKHVPHKPKLSPYDETYFLDRSAMEPNTGCWLWLGGADQKGYGKAGIERAHRASYATLVGPIPNGLLVCHHCDVPSCVNPQHLFLGTNADNMADMKRKGRQNKQPRPGESNGMSKLTGDAVRAIRSDPRPASALAAEYGVTKATINYARARHTWAAVI